MFITCGLRRALCCGNLDPPPLPPPSPPSPPPPPAVLLLLLAPHLLYDTSWMRAQETQQEGGKCTCIHPHTPQSTRRPSRGGAEMCSTSEAHLLFYFPTFFDAVYLVTRPVSLPLTPSYSHRQVKGAAMWARLGGVHVVGWILSILSTAAIAKATQVSLHWRRRTYHSAERSWNFDMREFTQHF